MRLKHLARLQYGDSRAVDARENGDVRVYGSNGQVGVHSTPNFNAPGIVVGRKGSYGKVTWAADGGFCIDTAYYVDRSSTQANLRYVFYLLSSLRLDEGSRDSAVPGLDRQIAHDRVIPKVSLNTQKTIADFLDRGTARIDQLIEKKERLVALLGEKRRSVVDLAVSRGAVNGGSGVKQMRLRHVASLSNSNVDKLTDADEIPVRLCNYVDVYKNEKIDNSFDFMRASATPAEIQRFGLRVGDVIITKDSEDAADIGVPAYVAETASDLVCGYHLTLLRSRPKIMRGDFLFWALNAKAAREQMSNAANGITRFGLTLNGMKNVMVPAPDLDTQKAVSDFLDHETAKLSQAATAIAQSIDLLRKYRAALITAAVTGQIDIEVA